MKNKLVICLFALSSITALAQNKVALTKEETIEYLKKKVNECKGHFRTPNGVTMKMFYINLDLSLDGEEVTLLQKSSNYNEVKNSSDYFERWNEQRFNPGQIASITEATTTVGEPIGLIKIKFNSQTCLAKNKVSWYALKDESGLGRNWGNHDGVTSVSSDEVGFVYLLSDGTNFNKIKKALEHLRDLYATEIDPFGETEPTSTSTPNKAFNSYDVAGSLIGKTGTSAEATLKEYGFVYNDDPGTQEANGLTIKYFSQEESFEFCIIATKGGSVVLVAFNVVAGEDDYYGGIFEEAMEKFENSAIAAGFKLKQPTTEENDEEKDFHNSVKKQKIYIGYDGSSEAWVYIYNEAIDISEFKQ